MSKSFVIALLFSFVFTIAAVILPPRLPTAEAIRLTSVNYALNGMLAQTAEPKITPEQPIDSTPPDSSASEDSPSERQQTSAPQAPVPQPNSQPKEESASSDRAVRGPYDVKAIEDSYRSLYGS